MLTDVQQRKESTSKIFLSVTFTVRVHKTLNTQNTHCFYSITCNALAVCTEKNKKHNKMKYLLIGSK